MLNVQVSTVFPNAECAERSAQHCFFQILNAELLKFIFSLFVSFKPKKGFSILYYLLSDSNDLIFTSLRNSEMLLSVDICCSRKLEI